MKKPLLSALVFTTALFSALLMNAQCGYVAPPIAQADTNILSTQLGSGTVSIKAVGTDLKWYDDAAKLLPIAGGTGSPFNTQMNSSGVTSSVSKNQCFYVTQTIAGCESNTDQVCVTIVDCPWTAPTNVGVAKCENDATLATTAMFANTMETGVNWQWYIDAALTYPINGANSQMYNPGGTSVGDVSYYVRYNKVEPISGQTCWSPKTQIRRVVYQAPKAIFGASVRSDYCITATIINLNGSDAYALPGTNQFEVDGITNTTATIIIGTLISDKTYNITYKRTTNNGCIDLATKSTTVHYAPPPVTTNFSKIIGTTVIPTITATPSSSKNSIQWYDSTSKKIAFATSSVYTDNSQQTKIGIYKYYVNQLDEYSCPGQYAMATISYTSCDADLPIVPNLAMCTYDNIPSFTITRGANSNANHQYEYRVYNSDPSVDSATPIITVASSTSAFDPSSFISKPLTAKINQFWIAEYDLTDGCMGKAISSNLTTKATAAPTVVYNTSACENTISSVNLSVTNIINGSTIVWYDSTATTIAEASTVGNKFIGNPYVVTSINTLQEGTYKYYVSQILGGCQSTKVLVTFRIKPKPAPPVVVGASSCYLQPFGTMRATSSLINPTIKWYASPSLSPSLVQTPYYTPTPMVITNTTTSQIPFYVTQTSDIENCVSDPATVYYQLYAKPAKPVFAATTISMCQSSTFLPIYTVTNASGSSVIKWIDNGTIAQGTTYTPKLPIAPALSTSFKAIQTENGCVSDTAKAVLVLIEMPPAPATTMNQSICLNDKPEAFLATASGPFTLKWYTNITNIGTTNNVEGPSYLPTTYSKPQNNSTSSATTSYYVTQTTTDASHCEGQKATVKLTVFNKYCLDSTITLNNGDSVLIGTSYHKTAESFDYTYTSTTGVDSVVHYNLVLAGDTTASKMLNPNSISISPVPANNKLYITNKGSQQIDELSIISEKGQVLYSNKKKVLGNTEIDLTGFSSGVYLLRYIIDGKLGTKTFVVVK
jgi:hypothetical protein